MKYIRTEDGHIYEIQTLGYGGVLIGHFKGADDDFNLYNSLRKWQLEAKVPYYLTTPNGYTTCEKQADTIEELCDDRYWVVVWKDREPEIMKKSFAIWHWNNNRNIIDGVYACIWIKAKLEPVAKMNDKGELELL